MPLSFISSKTKLFKMEIKDYYRVNCKIAKRLRNRRPDIYELHILYKMFTPRVQFLHNSDNDFIYASIDYLSQKGVKINTINCKLDSTSKTLNTVFVICHPR